ncbi:TPA: hypothetical protein ACIBS5_002857 [Salmonella enterica subsp. diarizonae serovar 60-67:z35:-]
MKTIAMLIMGFATPVICAIFAGLLAMEGKSGWGWFLFAAVLIMCSTEARVR